MVLNQGDLVISTLLLCFSYQVFGACPPSQYTDSTGTIQSPGFNTGKYSANMTCTYNIRVSSGQRITLEFKTLSILGAMPQCSEDSVEILVGCTTNTSIGKFCSCSNVSMPKIYSVDHCMTLVFKSDGSSEGKGFEAQYTTANKTIKLDPKFCRNDSLTPSLGALYTPNWPLMYPLSTSCVWKFNPLQTKIVRFFFTSFDLDGDPDCDPDRDPRTGDHIGINGTNTTGGQVIVEQKLCTMPADAFFPIKDMKTIEVRFRSNSDTSNDGTGVIAGYATYIKGYVDSNAARCTVGPPTTSGPSSTGPSSTGSVPTGSSTKPSSGTSTKLSGKPTIKDLLQSVFTVNETNNVTMVCRADGVPQPTINWTKTSSGKNVGYGEQFHIINTRGSDDGAYRCTATNELGSDSKVLTLHVQTRPTILTSIPITTNIPGAPGEEVDLTCTVSGKPTPTLSWKRNPKGNDLNPQNDKVKSITSQEMTITMKVVVTNAGKKNGDKYYCFAVNPLGNRTREYIIRERGAPDRPVDVKLFPFQVPDSQTVSVNVSWTPGYSGGFDQEFLIHYRKKGSDRDFKEESIGHPAKNVHTVQNLSPKTEYQFKMQASNQRGKSEASAEAQIQTPDSAVPPDRGTGCVDSDAARCTVGPPTTSGPSSMGPSSTGSVPTGSSTKPSSGTSSKISGLSAAEVSGTMRGIGIPLVIIVALAECLYLLA